MVHTLPFRDITVPSLGFGAMGLSHGLGSNLSLEEAEPVLLKAIELGCTFWDTAVVYGAGINEKLLGDFIKKHNVRDKLFIAPIDAVQAEYSAFETLHEQDGLIDTAKELGVAYVAYSPLGHGWLVDDFQYKSPNDFSPDDFRRSSPKFQGENFYKNKAIVDEIKALAAQKGYTTAQVALAWVAAQGMIAIPGTTKVKRLEENWASRDIEFTPEEKQQIRKLIDANKPVGERYSGVHRTMVGN
ncbi:hypothetical protein SBRCBS47491_008742 [Sporothrix bragantina]|uniref:NADP-dependent oxidoreductase domain-containing protein n=1 Tax=Sporothrix bragantina TaxID=671064 RepID=A0ABP0CNW5_9PEZI